MSALCQKQTFRPLLDIIAGGQGCSSSWSITRETSPQAISASGSGRCHAVGSLAHRMGARLSHAAGTLGRWLSARRSKRHHGTHHGRDIVLVAGIGQGPAVMAVNPKVPAGTVPEFIAYAKANPGKINMGSAGIGTPQHVIGELFKMMTGVNMVHVPYHGAAPELTDLIAGQVQVSFDPIQGSIGYIKGGMLRPLAVTTTTRTDALPNVPTIGEFVPGFEARTRQGLGAPSGPPAEITETLNKEVNDILADPRLKARFADLGITPMPMTPAECQRFITAETEKWAKVIKFAGIEPE
jgi:tripartite-type tricarboxylate transporter receptor subunit TctC